MDGLKLLLAPVVLSARPIEGGSAPNAQGARIPRTCSTMGTISDLTSSKHYSP